LKEVEVNPLADQQRPPQPQGQPQGNPNPLARLAAPLPGPPLPPPAPTAAQTAAALRRLNAVADAMRTVLQNPDLGQKNVRPQIMDQASRLLAAKVISLPELMNEVAKIGDDPLVQKSQVAAIFNGARAAAASVIDHHGAAVAAGKVPRDGGEKYDPAHHSRHFANLLSHYSRG
jgi:hypothetical protein